MPWGRLELPSLAAHASEACAYTVPPRVLVNSMLQVILQLGKVFNRPGDIELPGNRNKLVIHFNPAAEAFSKAMLLFFDGVDETGNYFIASPSAPFAGGVV